MNEFDNNSDYGAMTYDLLGLLVVVVQEMGDLYTGLLVLLVVSVQEMGELYTDLYILLSVSRRWESCTLTSS